MTLRTIVYDKYNVESVIMAALLSHMPLPDSSNEKNKCFSIDENIPSCSDEYIWININPTKELKKKHKGDHLTAVNFLQSLIPDSEAWSEYIDSCEFKHNTLILTYFDIVKTISPTLLNLGLLFNLGLAVELFNKNSTDMRIDKREFKAYSTNNGIEELALVYSNWKLALKCIFTEIPFVAIYGNTDEYLDSLKEIKSKINKKGMDLHILNMRVGYDNNDIVVFNTNMLDAPWYVKFLSIRYDYGLLYEIVGNKIIAIPWAKDRQVINFKKYVKKIMDKKYDVVFAGSMT